MNRKTHSTYPPLAVIPEPRHMVQTAVSCRLPRQLVALAGNGSPAEYARVCHRLASELNALGATVSFQYPGKNDGTGRLSLTLRAATTTSEEPAESGDAPGEKSRGNEGYGLQIGSDGIRITAESQNGLFYGVMTLIQLAGRRGNACYFPGVRIEDWPDLAIRGAHLQLPSRFFRYEYVANFIRELGRYKINTLLLEYPTNLRYENHPVINGPEAWTKEHVKQLIQLAEENFVTVIPLFQCLGHAEEVLKHPEYKHLREGENIWSQYCPVNPDVLDFYISVCEEILPLHDGPGYFHIGGDESYYLGHCATCQDVVAEKGKDGLYVDYINKICEYLKSRGKTPMLWDDMLTEYPAQIGRLCPEAVVCYWDYTPSDPAMPFLLFRNQGYYCHRSVWEHRKWKGAGIPNRRIKDLETMPRAMFDTYRNYLENPAAPDYLNPYPFYRFYQDRGFKTIGVPAAAGGEYNYYHVNHRLRRENVVGMIGTVQQAKGEGVIVASWLAGGLTMHLAYHPILAAAEHAWLYNGVAEDEFDRKFLACFYGTDAGEIVWAMLQLKESPSLCFNCEDNDVDSLNAFSCYATGNLKRLMDGRIEKLEQNPDRIEVLRANQKIHVAARQGVAILEKNARKVTRNRPEYDRLILGATLDLHKSSQVLLFHAAESVLRGENGGQSRLIKRLFEKFVAHKREIGVLKKRVTTGFADVLLPSTITDYNAVLFEGEEAKSDDYLERLSSIKRNVTCQV